METTEVTEKPEPKLDGIEVAQFKKMAIDAKTGHFPVHMYGDGDHVYKLAEALEQVCEDLQLMDDIIEELNAAIDKTEELQRFINTTYLSLKGKQDLDVADADSK